HSGGVTVEIPASVAARVVVEERVAADHGARGETVIGDEMIADVIGANSEPSVFAREIDRFLGRAALAVRVSAQHIADDADHRAVLNRNRWPEAIEGASAHQPQSGVDEVDPVRAVFQPTADDL